MDHTVPQDPYMEILGKVEINIHLKLQWKLIKLHTTVS